MTKERESNPALGADGFPTGGGATFPHELQSEEQLLDRYVLKQRIGIGGMGEVWEAFDRSQQRTCALKRILPQYLEDPKVVARFQREMELLSQLDTPFVIALYDMHLEHGFFTMERLEGQTLQAYLASVDRCPLPWTLWLLGQLCRGLQTVHAEKLVHRDVKPGNIFLCGDGIKLLDFGIARPEGHSQLTRTAHGILGTPYYLAPELLTGQGDPTPKTDVYSLGVLLYELFAGELPMVGSPPLTEVVEELFDQGKIAGPECPKELQEAFVQLVEQELEPLYRGAVRRSPTRRWSIERVQKVLEGIQKNYYAAIASGSQRRIQSLEDRFSQLEQEEFQRLWSEAQADYPHSKEPLEALSQRYREFQERGPVEQESWLQWQVLSGLERLRPQDGQRLPVLLQLKGSELQSDERPPITLCFCLDNSSSMFGEPMELVLQSVRQVVEQLQPQDRVGLVSFSTGATSWVAPQLCTGETLKLVHRALESIKADGWTAMHAGLEASFHHLPEARPEEVTRLFLLSDGSPNQGPSSAHELSSYVRQHRRHCTVSTFGFGKDHEETILQAIAKAGGGNYTYIQNADTALTGFALELGGLMSTVARQARLTIQPHEGCSVGQIRGDNETRYTAKGMELSLGDLIAGQTLDLLVELEVDARQASERAQRWATFHLEYFPPKSTETTRLEHPLKLAAAPNASTELHPDVNRELLLHQAGDAWKSARALADQRQFHEAIAHLHPVMEQLQQHQDWHDEASPMRDWYEQFVDEVELYERRPSDSYYKEYSKYAGAEMQIPGTVAASQLASYSHGTPMQQQMIQKLQSDEQNAVLEIYSPGASAPRIIPIHHEISIGRSAHNDLQLPSNKLSKRHAKIVPTAKGFVVVDMKTTNGTYLNGGRVLDAQVLQDEDQLHIGDFQIIFRDGEE